MDEGAFNFSDLIDDYLRRETRPAKIGTYWPSEIGQCVRQNYYKRFIPREMPKEKLRMFKSADLAHGFIRDVLASSDKVKLLAWEKPFSIICGDFEIAGRLDDVIVAKIANREEPIVIEVKSISGKTLDHLTGPKTDHVYQIHPYLKATRFEGRTASLAVIWYLARDTYADKFFTVFYDQRVMDGAIARIRELHEHLTGHTLPLPEAKAHPSEPWRCWFCPYEQECRSNYNPEVRP
jgi:CRISPR/Cas system-associated exonuclease Cas4 (RecB family)